MSPNDGYKSSLNAHSWLLSTCNEKRTEALIAWCGCLLTGAAAPLPFTPGNPALCGSCPLVTPCYCGLGDLLCYNCMLYLSYHFVCMHVYFVFSLFSGLFSFVDFPSVLWYCWLGLLTCKNRLPYNLYCVVGDVKHCTIHTIQLCEYCNTLVWALFCKFHNLGKFVYNGSRLFEQ